MPDELHLCLTDLLDQDLSSYEFFSSLPAHIREELRRYDVRSFREMQELASKLRERP